MGILDDAIREHLDLKRRLGAEEDELKRLEGEAFGPPTRPGDPDFPEQEASAEVAGDEPVTGEETLAPPPIAEAPSEELAAAAPATDEELIPPPTAAEPIAPATDEHAAEPAAGGLYDRSGDELDLELDVDLGEDAAPLEDTGESATLDEPAPPPPPAPDPAATDEQAALDPPAEPPAEAPIESLDTVEHHIEEAIEDTGEAELVEGELAPEAPPETPGVDPDADAEEDEDVLEETPEFLRDAPEDDELWFEQGEPKDFDF